MKTIILAGIPGCGKSTILQETLKHLPSVTVVNYGDCMLEEADPSGLSRDDLRKKPTYEQQAIGIRAAKTIARQKSPITIVDTHAFIRTDAGFCPGLPQKVLDILSPCAFVLVETSPALILERRSQDTSRARDSETEEQLTTHQELTRAYLTSCSMRTGATLCHITNNDPSVSTNAAPLIEYIQSIL